MRRAVFVSGIAFGVLGCGLIASLPMKATWQVLTGIAWSASVLRELQLLHRAWTNCRRVRMSADGACAILGRDGEWRPGRLVSGGVLLARIGWLRLQASGGPVFAELVHGERRTNRDWRRLHVIWRHIGMSI